MPLSHQSAVGALLIAMRDRLRPARGGALAPDDRLDGRTALVTGASGGLGRAVALALADRGARLKLAVRSDASTVLAEIEAMGRAASRHHVDLADLRSVEALADGLRGEPIHLLVLNAGVVPRRARRTPQGLELQLAVHLLANVALVDRLLESGTLPTADSPPARVVLVSSESHRSAALPALDELGVYQDYGLGGVMKRYGATKLLATVWAMEMARRLAGRVAVHALCPGPVASGIAREAPASTRPALDLLMRTFFASPAEAALPVVYLGAARELEGETGLYLHRWTRKDPAPDALDPEVGHRVLRASRDLIDAYRTKG